MSTVNTEEVERLVIELMKGVGNFGSVEGQDAVSAVMTFTYRFLNVSMELMAQEDRKENLEKIAHGLRKMAAMLEFSTMKYTNEKVH